MGKNLNWPIALYLGKYFESGYLFEIVKENSGFI